MKLRNQGWALHPSPAPRCSPALHVLSGPSWSVPPPVPTTVSDQFRGTPALGGSLACPCTRGDVCKASSVSRVPSDSDHTRPAGTQPAPIRTCAVPRGQGPASVGWERPQDVQNVLESSWGSAPARAGLGLGPFPAFLYAGPDPVLPRTSECSQFVVITEITEEQVLKTS